MSYDLYFWNQSKSCHRSPEEIVNDLSQGAYVECLNDIASGDVASRIKSEFDRIEEVAGDTAGHIQLIWDNGRDASFVASIRENHICIEAYQAPVQVLNRLIEIASEFECPLYDPQTNTRYTGQRTNSGGGHDRNWPAAR